MEGTGIQRGAPGPPAARANAKRAAIRFRLRHGRGIYATAGERGRARIHDISMSGVRLEHVSRRLPPGALARVGLWLGDRGEPIELAVEVARWTRTGFAARFVDMGPKLARELAQRLTQALAGN